MDLISLFDHFDLSHINEVIFANGQITIQLSWTTSMLQFREYVKIIKEHKPNDILIKFDTFTIIITN